MARRTKRPPVTRTVHLLPQRQHCSACGSRLWHLYQTQRTVTTLEDVTRLTLTLLRCPNPTCSRYHQPIRPEEEGAWALPHGEFGLDVIALIGALRYRHHRSVPEIHKALQDQNVAIAPRTVTYLLERYEELLALRLAEATRLKDVLTQQGHIILALDGLQPFRDHDVLWVLRDALSGEVLLARNLDSARQEDLAGLLREVKQALPVPILAVVSDAQRPIRLAVQKVLPGIPHQLCQFHYLKEAAKPIVEAERHAKTELKKYTRGVREIEREVAERKDASATTIRSYCLAVRSALSAVTRSYWRGLFHCYEVPGLPRTNNELERRFGTLRYHERRCSGRRAVSGGLVLRGAVRVIAVLNAERLDDAAEKLRLTDREAWCKLRQELERRAETRRAQRRFRRDPVAYLSKLEQQLLN